MLATSDMCESRHSFQNCSGVTRRNFLQIGAPLLGLGIADLLRLESQAAEAGRPASKKSLIVFWTDGGVSQQDTYDVKPDAPAEYRGMYQPIGTAVPGIVLGERLPLQAKVMDRLSIVRSVHHENGIHAPSAHWMQTGYFGPTLARNAAQKPSFGSVISRSLGSRQPPMPAYVTIPKSEAFGYQGAVYLGKAFNPFEVGADPNAADFKVPNLSLPGGLTARSVDSRRTLLKTFDTLRRDIDESGVMEGLDTFKKPGAGDGRRRSHAGGVRPQRGRPEAARSVRPASLRAKCLARSAAGRSGCSLREHQHRELGSSQRHRQGAGRTPAAAGSRDRDAGRRPGRRAACWTKSSSTASASSAARRG